LENRFIKFRFIPGMKPSLKEESLVTSKQKRLLKRTGGKALLILPFSLKVSLIIFIHSSKSSGDLCLVTSCKMDEQSRWHAKHLFSFHRKITFMSNDDVLQMRDAGEQAMGSIEYRYMVKQCVYCWSRLLGLQVSY